MQWSCVVDPINVLKLAGRSNSADVFLLSTGSSAAMVCAWPTGFTAVQVYSPASSGVQWEMINVHLPVCSSTDILCLQWIQRINKISETSTTHRHHLYYPFLADFSCLVIGFSGFYRASYHQVPFAEDYRNYKLTDNNYTTTYYSCNDKILLPA